MVKLDTPIRRELLIRGKPHTLVVDAGGLKLTRKGARRGLELSWEALTDGDAALAAALEASLRVNVN